MRNFLKHKIHSFLCCALCLSGLAAGVSDLFAASKKQKDEFTVVIDPGHGGKDHGAIDNGAREKDINLAVALKVGELVNKKLKDTKVIFTRNNDTFLSLQERADVANNAKADFFISIHTNSVDAKNKNRTSVAGASVYTQGNHKDDANMEVARRENAVIELENGYQQKYSGFDPNKDESYIIFELAQKNNLSESVHFAKDVQEKLVKVAGRKDRGVHQAGFWVLWATSMPAVLIELDFICNPESTKFMTSKEGVEKLAEAIFETIRDYEKSYMQKRKMLSGNYEDSPNILDDNAEFRAQEEYFAEPEIDPAIEAKLNRLIAEEKAKTDPKSQKSSKRSAKPAIENTPSDKTDGKPVMVMAAAPQEEKRDLSHSNLQATRSQRVARSSSDGRRRRSSSAREASEERDITLSKIEVKSESTGNKELAIAEPTVKKEVSAQTGNSNSAKDKKKKSAKKKQNSEVKSEQSASKSKETAKPAMKPKTMAKPSQNKETASSPKQEEHGGRRKSIKSKSL